MDPDERKELLEQELVRREHAIAKMLADQQVASLKHQLGKVPKVFHSTWIFAWLIFQKGFYPLRLAWLYAYLMWSEHTRKY